MRGKFLMKSNELDLYAKLMTDCFLEDPGIQIQFNGVPHRFSILEMQCRCEISAFSKLNGVSTFGSGEGIAMGYFSRDQEKLSAYLAEESAILREHVPEEVLAMIRKNAEDVIKIVQHDWYEKFVEGEVYVLQAIAVHPSVRGTGVFRKLLSPILESVRELEIPIILQTHSAANVAKYEHMGFAVKEKVFSDAVNLACYNLMKYPDPSR